jgi:hypothetical protein
MQPTDGHHGTGVGRQGSNAGRGRYSHKHPRNHGNSITSL